jgi:CBS domain-containing protein
MNLIVKNLVKKKPIYVEKGTKALDAIRIMYENNVGSLLILDKGKLFGIFTERDLLKAVAKKEDLNKPIEEFSTTKNLITIRGNESFRKAAELMAKHFIRHLIVVNGNNNPIGVVSIRDLISESHLLSVLSKIEEEYTGGD